MLSLALLTAHGGAAWPSEPVPLPGERPGSKSAKPEQTARPKTGPQQSTASRSGPLLLAPDAQSATPVSGPPAIQPPAPTKPASRITVPFATAATTATSPIDLSAVKQAIERMRKHSPDETPTTR